jgi:NTP pyrophosphatase (non-canonical NTP hydrolase)
MTPDEYQKAALSFKNPDTLYAAQRDNAVLGLVGEAGEIADKLKKHLFHGDADKHPFGASEVLDEAGDVLWYIVLLCEWAGVTLDQCMEYNIVKLIQRYPNKFEAKRSYERYTGLVTQDSADTSTTPQNQCTICGGKGTVTATYMTTKGKRLDMTARCSGLCDNGTVRE